jgi:hypothetical protein
MAWLLSLLPSSRSRALLPLNTKGATIISSRSSSLKASGDSVEPKRRERWHMNRPPISKDARRILSPGFSWELPRQIVVIAARKGTIKSCGNHH